MKLIVSSERLRWLRVNNGRQHSSNSEHICEHNATTIENCKLFLILWETKWFFFCGLVLLLPKSFDVASHVISSHLTLLMCVCMSRDFNNRSGSSSTGQLWAQHSKFMSTCDDDRSSTRKNNTTMMPGRGKMGTETWFLSPLDSQLIKLSLTDCRQALGCGPLFARPVHFVLHGVFSFHVASLVLHTSFACAADSSSPSP